MKYLEADERADGPGSSVGIVTGYGMNGPGIESRCWRRDYPHLSRPALGPTQPPVRWVPGLPSGDQIENNSIYAKDFILIFCWPMFF